SCNLCHGLPLSQFQIERGNSILVLRHRYWKVGSPFVSSGRSKGRFAPFGPPLMSNVLKPMCGSLRSLAPVPRSPLVMRHRMNRHRASQHFEPHRIRKPSEHALAVTVVVRGPSQWGVGKAVNRVEYLGPKGVRRGRVPFLVPVKRLSNVVLGSRSQNNGELAHKLVRRARASAQGRAVAARERSSSLRWRISSAHAFVTVASSSPSRLSSSATTNAERSSGSRASASSRRWSTRAFMRGSLEVLYSKEASNPSTRTSRLVNSGY